MSGVAVGGGRGFIGAALVRALAAAGAQVVAFGREGLSEETCPKDGYDKLVWVGGGREGDAAALEAAHVTAPLQALAAGHARGVRRAVYVSSGEVYGAQAVPFHEDQPRLGETAYARAKIRGEDLFKGAAERLGVAVVVVRPGVVYGPGQGEGMLIPSLLAALRAGRRFACTRGEQTRDFVHVGDLARLIARCLEEDAPVGVYNVGTGVETPVAEVVRGLARRLGRAELVDLGARPYRAGEVMRYALDPGRARERLGLIAEVALADGLDRLCPEEQVDA